MLRRPESSKLIREAFASPLGSTSRKKAQQTFRIMSKLSSSYDGAGGPGMMSNQMPYGQESQQEIGPTTISNENSKGMVIFNRIPKPRIIYGKAAPKPLTLDGGGGPGFTPPTSATSSLFSLPQFNNGGLTSLSPSYRLPSSPQVNASVTGGTSSLSTSPAVRPIPPWLYSTFATPFTSNPSKLSSDLSISSLAGVQAPPKGKLASLDPNYTLPTTLQENKPIGFALSGTPDSSLSMSPSNGTVRPIWDAIKGVFTFGNQAQTSIPPVPKTSSNAGTTTVLGGGVPTPTTGVPSFYSTLGGGTATTTSSSPSQPQPQTGGVTGGLSSLGNAGGNAVTQSGVNNGIQSVGEAGSFTDRLVNTESGGDYSAVGSLIQNGENAGYRALGKYQIMPNLHFSTIGLDPNNEEDVKRFLTTPSLQDTLYKKIIEDLATKYNGDEAKIAAAYFGGDKAAQAYGTPEGDKITDGHMSINQYVNSIIGGTSGTSSGSSVGTDSAPTGVVATAADYIKKNLGAGQFVLDTLKTEGGTLNERAAKNKASVWKDYDIEKLKLDEVTLKNEVRDLPKDQADYIRSRDTYLKETDQAIADYMVYMQENNDMSDPAVKQQMNSHLNYLYTLRGRQNKTYVGYLNDAVTAHQNKLKDTEDTLTQRLAEAETSLNSMNAITQDEYNMRAAALNDMYTTLKNAPAEAMQMTILAAQAHEAQYGSAVDTSKMLKENGFIQQGSDLKGIVWNKDGYVLPGPGNGTPSVRLLDKVNQLEATDPLILPSNIILSYLTGVGNYLSAPLSKDEYDGYGITDEKKRQLAAEAVAEIGLLTQSEDPQIAAAGRDYGETIKQQFINVFAPDISAKGKAPLIMEAIKKLDRGNKAPPTLDEFIKMVTDKTQDQKDSSIAESIYNTYMEFIKAGETPQTAIKAFLYPGNTTEERNGAAQFTPSEFSYKLAQIVADDIYSRSLI